MTNTDHATIDTVALRCAIREALAKRAITREAGDTSE